MAKKVGRQVDLSEDAPVNMEPDPDLNQECYGGEEGSNNNNNGKPTRGSQILDASRLKKHKANSQRDMYRQFDGTALMAIGMCIFAYGE